MTRRTPTLTMPSYPRTLFCLAAVYNRVETTRRFLEQLRRQRGCDPVVLIVDDGSTDGTGAMLRSVEGLALDVVRGSGDLWWGGAMRVGMKRAAARMGPDDALLLLNDDITIEDDFLARFIAAARALGPRVVIGCQQRAQESGAASLYGYLIDHLRCRIDDVTAPLVGRAPQDVDALCGRGMLLSREILERVGYVDGTRFPHYLGDIEYSARAKDLGFRIVCDPSIVVTTSFAASDSGRIGRNTWRRLTSPVSSKNFIQHYRFWLRRGPKVMAYTAAVRFPLIKLGRAFTGGAAAKSTYAR